MKLLTFSKLKIELKLNGNYKNIIIFDFLSFPAFLLPPSTSSVLCVSFCRLHFCAVERKFFVTKFKKCPNWTIFFLGFWSVILTLAMDSQP